MTTCIRCGCDLAVDQENLRYLDSTGSRFCTQSLPGEASVHRVANQAGIKPPMTPKQKRQERRRRDLERIAGLAVQGTVGYGLGALTGNLLSRAAYGKQHDVVNGVSTLNPFGGQ